MRSRRLAILAVVLVIAVAVAIVLGRGWIAPEPALDAGAVANESSLREQARPPSVDGARAPVASASTEAGATERPPLPPLNTPLIDIFDSLAERARRGDGDAACRLAAELSRCRQARRNLDYASDLERELARRDDLPEPALDRIVRSQEVAETLGSGCDGVAETRLREVFDWQRLAAELDPRYRLRFVLHPGLDRRDFLSDYERWGEYRALALPWLEAAARAGDASAIVVLARIYGDHRESVFLMPPFRVRDDERFVYYAELMERRGVDLESVRAAAAEARARLSPEARARIAERLAILPPEPPDERADIERALGASLAPPLAPEDCGERVAE